MSTKTTSTQNSSNALQYDPASKNIYNQLTGSSSKQLLDMINNPFNNPLYSMGLGQSMKGAGAMGNNAMQSLMQNMKQGGFGGNSGNGFMAAQMGKMGRSNLTNRANANTGNVMNALQRQMQGTAMGMSFNPLLTGEKGNSNSSQTTGGLGTWLPQLIGAGLGMAGGAMTGGLSGAAGGLFGKTQSMPSSQWGGAATGSSMYPGFTGLGTAQGPPNPLMFG